MISLSVLPPVRKAKPFHYSSPSTALIAALIEETLNPCRIKSRKSASILVISSIL